MTLHIEITNDGTGTKEMGFYNYRVFTGRETIEEGRIEWFPRKEGWLSLVQRLITASILKLRM